MEIVENVATILILWKKLLAAGNETPPMTIRLNWLRVGEAGSDQEPAGERLYGGAGVAVPECASC